MMRSWNKRIKSLSVLAAGNVPLENALNQLKQLQQSTKDPGRPTPEILKQANERIEQAFVNLEQRAAQEVHADQIWQLMRAGRGDEALKRIAEIRSKANNNLNEVDALWKLVSGIAARNELLVEESEGLMHIEDLLMPEEVCHG